MPKKAILTYLSTARPQTWFAALCPVAIGLSLVKSSQFSFPLALITLFTAVLLQITANFANDYFDHDKGADSDKRLGPLRAIHYGEISPKELKNALRVISLITVLFGATLVWHGGIVIGALFLLALPMAYLYTASKYALSYLGLGEMAAFLFFGPIAAFGSYYLQTGTFSWDPIVAGCAAGCFAVAIIEVNYLRDREEDLRSGKKTVVVRYGPILGKAIYFLAMVTPHFLPFYFYSVNPFSLLACLCILPAKPLIVSICKLPPSSLHNQILAKTGVIELIYTILFVISQTFLFAHLPHAN